MWLVPSIPEHHRIIQVRDDNFLHHKDSPVNDQAEVIKPMHQETPLLLHPPEFSKSAKTKRAVLWGDR